jgi:hypothetical protein
VSEKQNSSKVGYDAVKEENRIFSSISNSITTGTPISDPHVADSRIGRRRGERVQNNTILEIRTGKSVQQPSYFDKCSRNAGKVNQIFCLEKMDESSMEADSSAQSKTRL